MDFVFLDAWDDFLPREGGHVVSLAGGGGKTSLLRACALALRSRGVPVVATTTTRTEPLAWPGLRVADFADLEAGAHRDEPLLYVRAGPAPEDKWPGLGPAQADALGRLLPRHVALVEADGAAQLPVKLHRDDEPPWPSRTSLAILVLGLGALGQPIAATLHRHGRLPAPWLPSAPDAVWTWDLLLTLLAGTGGYRSRVPGGVPVALALTQLAACRDAVGLFGFVGQAMAAADAPVVLLGELAGESPSLRAACRVDRADEGPAGVAGDGDAD